MIPSERVKEAIDKEKGMISHMGSTNTQRIDQCIVAVEEIMKILDEIEMKLYSSGQK